MPHLYQMSLSGTIFNIAVDTIKTILSKELLISQLIDDLGIMLRAATLKTIEKKLNHTLKLLEKWSQKFGFTFSTEKTAVVHFCRKRKCTENPKLYLHGQLLPCNPSHRFLGLIFDKKLTWAPHITDLRHKTINSLKILKTVSNRDWGADRAVLLRLYKALIRSKLEYGSIVYGSARTSLLESIEVVHRQALRICTGAYRSSPRESILVEASEQSFNQRRTQLMLNYYHKITAQPWHIAHNALTNQAFHAKFRTRPRASKPVGFRAEETLETIPGLPPVFQNALPTHPPWISSKIIFNMQLTQEGPKSHILPIAIKKFYNHCVSQKYPAPLFTHIFTDGSKLNSRVGAAFVVNGVKHMFPLHGSCTVYTAELYAIMQSLYYCIDVGILRVAIFTDNLSSVQALSTNSHKNSLVETIRSLCHKLKQVTIVWVPSHTGIKGNEQADEAAKLATELFLPPMPLITTDDAKNHIKKELHRQWQNEWTAKGHNFKLFPVKPIIQPWETGNQKKRRDEVALARLRIGHTHLTHQHLMKKEPESLCDLCNSAVTVEHVLLDCPKYHTARIQNQLKNTLREVLEDEPISINRLIAFLNQTNLINLI